jgi:hypothetical protein
MSSQDQTPPEIVLEENASQPLEDVSGEESDAPLDELGRCLDLLFKYRPTRLCWVYPSVHSRVEEERLSTMFYSQHLRPDQQLREVRRDQSMISELKTRVDDLVYHLRSTDAAR